MNKRSQCESGALASCPCEFDDDDVIVLGRGHTLAIVLALCLSQRNQGSSGGFDSTCISPTPTLPHCSPPPLPLTPTFAMPHCAGLTLSCLLSCSVHLQSLCYVSVSLLSATARQKKTKQKTTVWVSFFPSFIL